MELITKQKNMFHEVLYWHGFVTSSDVWVFDFVNKFWFQFLNLKNKELLVHFFENFRIKEPQLAKTNELWWISSDIEWKNVTHPVDRIAN